MIQLHLQLVQCRREDARMRTLLVIATIILAASAANFLDEEWSTWKTNYEKKYVNSKEEGVRRQIWEETWHKVQKHNSLAEKGLKNYTLAMNMFADMTVKELIPTACNSKRIQPKQDTKPESSSNFTCDSKKKIKNVVDWRTSGCVSPVKNSGLYCQAWWAFSTVGVLESRYCIKKKQLIKFSEQQLIDCNDGNDGCCAGSFESDFKYVSQKGIMASKNYEYKAGQFECEYNPMKTVKIKVNKYYTLIGEESIANEVETNGPVAVTMYITPEFFLYNGGVFDGECFSNGQAGMTIVGFGSACGTDYWLLKNNWGKKWGESGYVRVKRNNNHCGIANTAVAGDIVGSK
ncbi:cathepsin L-like proteinase [Pyxicephalus adspersus]|uniref:cathepsin L-like proteinase n=1 Tax=Pyxicephalus adspersus TaxID=30357 RepID=UPI003B5A52D3